MSPAEHPPASVGSDRAESPQPTNERPWLLPVTCLVSALGLLIQSIGYALGWLQVDSRIPVLGIEWRDPDFLITTFYVGLVLIVVPFAAMLAGAGASRRQRVAGSVAYATLLYLSWMLLNPVMGNHFDENLQTTTLLDILGRGELFAPNSMLPVSPWFPGLSLVAAGLHWLLGLPVVGAQVLTVLLARLVLVLGLYGLVLRITRRDRAASVAVVLYAANPQFYYFDAQFNYDTLAIGLAVLVFRLALERGARWWWGAVISMALLAVTHHLGSWATVGVLWCWTALRAVGRHRGRSVRPVRPLLALAVVGTVFVVAWGWLAHDLLVVYLEPLFDRSGSQLSGVFAGEGGGRELFADTAGVATPLWERLLMLGASALWCLALIPPAWLVLRGRLLPKVPARFLPWTVGGVYPLLLIARVSPNAAEVAVRASAYVMLAVSLLVAAWWTVKQRGRAQRLGALAAAVVLALGGVLLGAGARWEHQAGPFMGAAQARAVDSQVIAVARWAGANLPARSRIATDTTLGRVIPNFADLVPVTYLSGSVNVAALFADERFTDENLGLLSQGEVDFVIVDTRLSDSPSRNGTYYEPSDLVDTTEITPEALAKFDGAPGFTRLTEGPIEVYDVRALRGEPETMLVSHGDPREHPLPGPFEPLVFSAMAPLTILVLGAIVAAVSRSGARLVTDRAWLLPLAVVLPAAAGLSGLAAGYAPLVGAGAFVAVTIIAAVLHLWRRRRRSSAVVSRTRAHPGAVLAGVGAWAVVAFSVAVAVMAAWQGLFGDAPVVEDVRPQSEVIDAGATAR